MKATSILLFLHITLLPLGAAAGRAYTRVYTEQLPGGESRTVVELMPISVYPKGVLPRRGFDSPQIQRMIRNLKIVYPIAKEANLTLKAMENHLLTLKTKREQDAFVKAMEKQLKIKYTPVLKQMTFSQGKILIKLIDRETSRTSYELVKEIRGGFSAFMWQGVARLFGANLKDQYDAVGDDRVIEILIQLYEAGEI